MEKTESIKKRVFLWGWYGFENLGDDLLLKTMLQHLHGDITVPMQKPYVLPAVKQVKRSYKELVRGVFSHDVVIIGPGGLFPFDNKPKVLLYYLITRLWILMGREVIFFGIGISEKMGNLSAVLWQKMAKTADLFITRSENVLERLKLIESEKIHAMADCVFASEVANEIEYPEENRVAISVANLQNDNQKAFDDTVEKWSEVVKKLINKGFSVDLIAFTKGADDKMINAILSNLKNCGGVQPLYYSQATNAVSSWNRYKFAICMRFHSLVLSILNDVPAIPIAYGHKTFSLAEKCGLNDYLLVWNTYQSEYFGKTIDISASQILKKVDLLCNSIDSAKTEMLKNKRSLIGSASAAFMQLEKILKQ